MLKNRALTYIITVYAVTFLYSLLYIKFPYTSKPVGFVLTMIYMFIPLACTLVLQKLVYKEPLREIGFTFKFSPWYFFALLPIVVALLTFVISLGFPGVSYDPEMSGMLERMGKALTAEQMEKAVEQIDQIKGMYLYMGILNAIVLGATVNAVFGLGEEAGWRGFLLKELRHLGFYKASLIIGVVWGFWHAPVILQGHNFPDHSVAGVFIMTAWTILLSPLFTYVVFKTGSVVPAAIMHGVLNASSGIAIGYVSGGSDLTVGLTGAAGIIAVIVVNAGLYVYDKYFAKERIIV